MARLRRRSADWELPLWCSDTASICSASKWLGRFFRIFLYPAWALARSPSRWCAIVRASRSATSSPFRLAGVTGKTFGCGRIRWSLSVAWCQASRDPSLQPVSCWRQNALARAQPHARAQKLLRIDRFAVGPGFIMQMRAGGAAGRADFADHLADLDGLADLDADLGE